MEGTHCPISSQTKYAFLHHHYANNRNPVMKKHTTPIVTCFLFFIGITQIYSQTVKEAQPVQEAPQYKRIIQETLHKEITLTQLTIGQKYMIQFFIEDYESCLPIAKMEIPFSISRETAETFILDFVATDLSEKINLKTPCNNNEKNKYLATIQCTTCLHEQKTTARFAPVIEAQSGLSEDYLVRDVFVAGGCYDIENIAFKGPDIAKGEFSKGNSIGFEGGIILSTGDVKDCSGPNSATNTTSEFSFGNQGDNDLNTLLRIVGSQITSTTDVAVLEFDFTPTSDKVSFEASRFGQSLLTYSLLSGMKGQALRDGGSGLIQMPLSGTGHGRVAQLVRARR